MRSAALSCLLLATSLQAQELPAPAPSQMVPAGATVEQVTALATRVVPSERQHRWLGLEFTAFVHFGMNTFTDREWGDGKEDPSTFAPTAFDARQWAQSFRAAGMRGVVLTCKHHDGFCLWPTGTTEHSVKASPWKDGKGDIVREVADACREAGLEFGIYLSPWDRNHEGFGTDKYNEVFRAQLRELLTEYGDLHDVWFDGAHAPKDDPKTFDWVGHYALIRELQPGACISVMGPDVRWCGNEAGNTRGAEWNVIPLRTEDDRDGSESWPVAGAYFGVEVTARDLGSRARLEGARRLVWWPAMTNTSIRPGWFYHASQDGQVKSLDHLLDVYERSVGGGTQFLLNIPPDRRGLIHENDVARLREIGAVLRATYGSSLSDGARVVDEGPRHREVHMSEPQSVDVVVLAEDVRNHGQRVEAFVLEARQADGTWTQVAEGQTIGPKRIVRFEPVTADAFRVRITADRAEPALATFSLHRRPAVLRAPVIRRSADGAVTIATKPGTFARYTTDGSEPGPGAVRYEAPFPLPFGGTVRARSYADGTVLDVPAETDATVTFGLRRADVRIHTSSSEQAPDEAASMCIDGDPSTIWHSRWSPDSPSHPHRLVLDLGEVRSVTGLTYLPRQDGATNGTITRCAVSISADGKAFEPAVQEHEFANVRNNPIQQAIRFEKPKRARFVEFRSLQSVDDKPWASAAEIGVLVAPVSADRNG
jgi:alpha-L-fucosidase